MLSAFIRTNQQTSQYVARKAPWLFKPQAGRNDLHELVRARAASAGTVLEIGGVDRPMLQKSDGFHYVGLDIDDRPKCYSIYDEFHVQSVEDAIPTQCDLAISQVLLEHVPDNRRAIQSIANSVSPGGFTAHYIPSKNHPYSLLLRLVGNRLQKKLINITRKHAGATTGYPAYFDHCSPGQMRKLFSEVGFKEISIQPIYSAEGYFAFFFPAFLIIAIFNRACSALNAEAFCSGFIITAKKPLDI